MLVFFIFLCPESWSFVCGNMHVCYAAIFRLQLDAMIYSIYAGTYLKCCI